MQNWKLNLDLEHFININEGSLFFQDDFNFSYSDLIDQINSLNLSMQDNAVLFLVSKKINIAGTFTEIKNGYKFIAKERLVRGVMIGLGVGIIGGGVLVPLGNIYASTVLGGGAGTYSCTASITS